MTGHNRAHWKHRRDFQKIFQRDGMDLLKFMVKGPVGSNGRHESPEALHPSSGHFACDGDGGGCQRANTSQIILIERLNESINGLQQYVFTLRGAIRAAADPVDELATAISPVVMTLCFFSHSRLDQCPVQP